MEGEDVTKRMPLPFVSILIVGLISYCSISYLDEKLIGLASAYEAYDAFFQCCRGVLEVSGIYIIAHAYMFYKNLPFDAVFGKFQGCSNANPYKKISSGGSSISSSTGNYLTNPAYNSLPGNIYHR